MIKWSKHIQVHLYSEQVDMRKQLDGLLMIINEHIIDAPNNKTIYLFCNRYMDKIKIIFWDGTGFVLLYKRLEKGKFKFKEITKDLQISTQQLEWLLAGYDFVQIKNDCKLEYSEYL